MENIKEIIKNTYKEQYIVEGYKTDMFFSWLYANKHTLKKMDVKKYAEVCEKYVMKSNKVHNQINESVVEKRTSELLESNGYASYLKLFEDIKKYINYSVLNESALFEGDEDDDLFDDDNIDSFNNDDSWLDDDNNNWLDDDDQQDFLQTYGDDDDKVAKNDDGDNVFGDDQNDDDKNGDDDKNTNKEDLVDVESDKKFKKEFADTMNNTVADSNDDDDDNNDDGSLIDLDSFDLSSIQEIDDDDTTDGSYTDVIDIYDNDDEQTKHDKAMKLYVVDSDDDYEVAYRKNNITTDNRNIVDDVEAIYKKMVAYGINKERNTPIGLLRVNKCTNLDGVLAFKDIPNINLSLWETENVESMRGLFYKSNFNNTSICSWDFSNVKHLTEGNTWLSGFYDMFYGSTFAQTDELNQVESIRDKRWRFESDNFKHQEIESTKASMRVHGLIH